MRVRIITVGLVLGLLSSNAFALIGSPNSELDAGQWSIGSNYQYSSQDLDTMSLKYNYSWIDYEPGGAVDDQSSGSGTEKNNLKDVNINHYYGQVNYGLSDNLEVFGRLGMSDIKIKTQEVGDNEWLGVNLDNEFSWGLGAKYTLSEKENVNWGISCVMNWLNSSLDDEGYDYYEFGGYSETEVWDDKIDFDIIDILIAVGPTFDMGEWKLYGGGFYQMTNADLDVKETGSWEDSDDYYGVWTDKASGDSDTDSFGGFVGAEFGIGDSWNMAVEFLGSNNGWGAGAGIKIPF